MNDAMANSPALEPDRPPGEGWTRARWLTVIALVATVQVALIFLFGEKKEMLPRAMLNAPTLKLADGADELLALNDPTLFVLPNQRDFASAVWLKKLDVKPPSFRWTEPPRWLPLPANGLAAQFGKFVQTNFFASYLFDFGPVSKLNTPTPPIEPALAQNSTIQIEDELAQRQLPAEISLTNWPYADVLAPCVVQVLVNSAGNVVSSVLLTPSGYAAADQRALEIARTLRFTPAANLTFGRIVFNWHTVPP